jgi:2-polyprenyl-6-methoxyphenol hydroxylase-like FAD-dependent oxidoreductase
MKSVIAGGSLGGLMAGLEFRAAGVPVSIHERSERVLNAGSFLRRTCSEFRDRRRHRHFLGIYNRFRSLEILPYRVIDLL